MAFESLEVIPWYMGMTGVSVTIETVVVSEPVACPVTTGRVSPMPDLPPPSYEEAMNDPITPTSWPTVLNNFNLNTGLRSTRTAPSTRGGAPNATTSKRRTFTIVTGGTGRSKTVAMTLALPPFGNVAMTMQGNPPTYSANNATPLPISPLTPPPTPPPTSTSTETASVNTTDDSNNPTEVNFPRNDESIATHEHSHRDIAATTDTTQAEKLLTPAAESHAAPQQLNAPNDLTTAESDDHSANATATTFTVVENESDAENSDARANATLNATEDVMLPEDSEGPYVDNAASDAITLKEGDGAAAEATAEHA